jgi:glucokinase
MEVYVDNDAKALALAEGWKGAAVGVANFIGMVVSTGVGGGIVLNGKLLDGADGNAGHVGHMFVEPGGHQDANGVRGLLEGSASGTGIAGATGKPASEADTAMRRQTGIWVGRAVASVANLLDLQLAVVAGSVALGFGDDFFGAAQETIDDLCKIQHARGTEIKPAGLGDQAPLIGAGAVGFRALGYPILTAG